MLKAKGKKIIMAEGDFGLSLPINFTGIEFNDTDTIKLTIKDEPNGATKIEKNLEIEENKAKLILTKEESEALTPNDYCYAIDWYRGEDLLCNLILNEEFIVEDKV